MTDQVRESLSILDEASGRIDLRDGSRTRRSPIQAGMVGGFGVIVALCGAFLAAKGVGLVGSRGLVAAEPMVVVISAEKEAPAPDQKGDDGRGVMAPTPKPAEEPALRVEFAKNGDGRDFGFDDVPAPPVNPAPSADAGGAIVEKKSGRTFPSERGRIDKIEAVRKALDEAREKYLAKTEGLDKQLSEALEKAKAEATKANDREKLAKIERQREAIEKRGELDGPVSAGDYKKSRERARDELEHVFRKASADLTAAGKKDDAGSVWQEFVDLTADSPADRLLRNRGLFRRGKFYVDPAPEASVLGQFGDSRRKYDAMSATIAAIAEVVDNDRMILQLLDHWDYLVAEIRKRRDVINGLPMMPKFKAQRDALEAEIVQLKVGPVPGPNGPTPGLEDTVKELDMRFNRAPGPPMRRQLVENFKEAKGAYIESLGQLRQIVNMMNTRYAEFDHDGEVKETLAGLKLKIGPSDGPKKAATTLSKAEREVKALDPTVKLMKAVPLDRRKRNR